MYTSVEVRDARQRAEPLVRGARHEQPKSDDGPVWGRREVDAPAPEKRPQLRPHALCVHGYSYPCPCSYPCTCAPEILDAAQNNPTRFAELIRQTRQRHMEAQVDADRERMLLEADPFSLDAQRKIEEAIQQQAVLDNLEHALEYSPEFFGRVTML